MGHLNRNVIPVSRRVFLHGTVLNCLMDDNQWSIWVYWSFLGVVWWTERSGWSDHKNRDTWHEVGSERLYTIITWRTSYNKLKINSPLLKSRTLVPTAKYTNKQTNKQTNNQTHTRYQSTMPSGVCLSHVTLDLRTFRVRQQRRHPRYFESGDLHLHTWNTTLWLIEFACWSSTTENPLYRILYQGFYTYYRKTALFSQPTESKT